MEPRHVPVLLSECIELLNIRPDGVYVDGTLGAGGHSEAIAGRLTTGRLIGIDRDDAAIREAGARLIPFGDRITLVRENFKDIDAVLSNLHIERVDGVLLDLGVSSMQLDDAERGFSYHTEAPLDMRMSREDALTAGELVNTWSRDEISDVLREYGEERFAGRIAAAICREREKAPIDTTTRLSEIIKSAIPAATRRTGPHPARRSFQGIRIAVNRELEGLSETMERIVDRLNEGGRLAVITFHSLEDRAIKEAFNKLAHPCECPPGFPVCICGKKPKVSLVTRKPVAPGEEELLHNPRARSAKLRVAQRL